MSENNNENHKKNVAFPWKKIMLLTAVICVIFTAVVLYQFNKEIDLSFIAHYEIPEGLTSQEIAVDLAKKKVIESPFLFNIYVKLNNLDRELQAGYYEFPMKRMKLTEVVRFLTQGTVAKEIWFTIPEGYTTEQIVDVLEAKGVGKKEEIIDNIKGEVSSVRYTVFNEPRVNLEGYLFPDTYRVFEDSTIEDVINKMLSNFEKKVTPEMRDSMSAQDKTLEEIIIMASIIEREVRTSKDMALVSDILWRRQEHGWKLEVDSTLNYAIGGKNPALTYNQLTIDSLYNTYMYAGLPPTPISNPGKKAINAALYREKNDYWFYLSKPDGETVFSKTLEEHVGNKKKYLEQ